MSDGVKQTTICVYVLMGVVARGMFVWVGQVVFDVGD